ncbi:MAG: HAD family hydrolase [Clostridia bacterium]|nr:HAD family hydrolase [Clostridia bacterium]
MKYKYIFFDWNGTLLDDAYASFQAVNAMLANRGLLSITFEQYREYIDVPIIRFYEKVMDMTEESMDDLAVEFNMYYQKFLPEIPIFEGLHELLGKLCISGIQLYIFSSSNNNIILPYLKKFDLLRYFTSVLGADDFHVGSKIKRTCDYIEDNSITSSEILFVGDMVHDSDVAKNAGGDCVLISSGHQSEEALLASGYRVISSVAELSALLCL